MPAIYAHYSFGKKVFRQLPNDLKKIAGTYKREYLAGLQGPDFLFFYNPLRKNRYGELGSRIHKEEAAVFLERAAKILRVTGMESPEGAYVMGFICHFMLDSSCHGYVTQMIGETGESHTEQETEFDRYMMEQDGKDPLSFPLYRLVDTSQELAETMSVFYKGLSTYTVRISQERMRLIKRLFHAPCSVKRRFLTWLMTTVFGAGNEYVSQVMQSEANPQCEPICEELSDRLENAVAECALEIRKYAFETVCGKEISQRMKRDFN